MASAIGPHRTGNAGSRRGRGGAPYAARLPAFRLPESFHGRFDLGHSLPQLLRVMAHPLPATRRTGARCPFLRGKTCLHRVLLLQPLVVGDPRKPQRRVTTTAAVATTAMAGATQARLELRQMTSMT